MGTARAGAEEWATVSEAEHPAVDDDRAWALVAAAGVAALEATGLITALAVSAPRAAPFAIALLATKYPFCLALMARRPGAYMVLWLWELAGLGAALVKPHLALSTRFLELGAAGLCAFLLAAAASLFPGPKLPTA
ncbi:MAG: hypothetical protein QOG64_3218 [Acidimicrobiaceae bacterium]|jgi:hypothetical protein|nr:hypothetical protein [Acidimicrobiaceae bacterium]